MLHPWIGLIFFVAILQMYGMWASQMHVRRKSTSVWFKSVRHYVQNEDDKMPPAGRYNAGQKLLFWGFWSAWCFSSSVDSRLWFPEYIPWSLRWLRYIAVLIHASSALLTIGLFLIHVYMGVFAERGALDSMVHGDVSMNFVKRYHPSWYKELTGEPSSPKK